jgi:hypothetical protein
MVRSEALTATSMKMTVFFPGFHHAVWQIVTDLPEELTASITTLIMEAVRTSETVVSISQTTQCNIPEDSHLQALRSFQFILRFYKNICSVAVHEILICLDLTEVFLWFSSVPPSKCQDSTLNYAMITSLHFFPDSLFTTALYYII